ncbi:MAG: hypothetical protein ACKVU0_06480 [Saprospiraceae bacterium]
MQNLVYQIQTALKTLHKKLHNVCKAERPTHLSTHLAPSQSRSRLFCEQSETGFFTGARNLSKCRTGKKDVRTVTGLLCIVFASEQALAPKKLLKIGSGAVSCTFQYENHRNDSEIISGISCFGEKI